MANLKQAILNVIGNSFFTTAQVIHVHPASLRFVFIELESAAFKKLKWSPGEKIQINTGDWNVRTYTPLSLDTETGRLGILAYIHGNGPGSRWAADVKAGDSCQLIGPGQSLKLSDPSEPVVMFGDETTIAVAATFKRSALQFFNRPNHQFIFEAESPDEIRKIAADLGLENIKVFARAKDGTTSAGLLQSVLDATRDVGTNQVILTGRAQSIQFLRAKLKSTGFPMNQIRTKAYWSEGKAGLD